eukprot:1195077-Prorocentrum_minimum.AAC.9
MVERVRGGGGSALYCEGVIAAYTTCRPSIPGLTGFTNTKPIWFASQSGFMTSMYSLVASTTLTFASCV